MFSQVKKTIKHLIIYSLGGVSNKIVGLILLPVYTAHLAAQDYGVLALLEITSQLIVEIFSLNLANGLLRWTSSEENESNRKSIIFTVFFATFILAGIVSATLIPLGSKFSFLLFSSLNYSDYFTVLIISSSITILNKIPLVVIRLNEKPVLFLISNTTRFVTVLLLNIYFVVFLDMGVMGIITGQLIGNLMLLLITFPYLFKNFTFKFDVHSLVQLTSYSLPLILSTTAAMVFNLGDRYFLSTFLDLARVGIYALGYKIGALINTFLIQSFYLGFTPLAFKKIGKPDEKRYLSKILTYFTFAVIFSSLALSLFGQEIIKLFTLRKEYWEAYFVVPLIAFAFSIKGIQYIFTLGFQYKKETKYQAMIYFSGAIISVVLNLLLIPPLDIYGSALAAIVTFSIMAVLSYSITKKIYPIPYEIKKIIMLLILGSLLIGAGFISFQFDLLLRLSLKVVLLISFPLILYMFNFYEEQEIRSIKILWKEWKNPLKWKDNFQKINF